MADKQRQAVWTSDFYSLYFGGYLIRCEYLIFMTEQAKG